MPTKPGFNDPTYGVGGPPTSLYEPALAVPSFKEEVEANWRTSWFDQYVARTREGWMEPEEGFNPWEHLQGYEDFASDLVVTRSTAEMNELKARIVSNQRDRDLLARGEWGILASLFSGLGDPSVLIPIGAAGGLGFVKGAMIGGASNTALSAVTESVRIKSDPGAHWDELSFSLGASALFGGLIGGVAGHFGGPGGARRGKEAAGTFMRGIDMMEGDVQARRINWKEEGIEVRRGRTNAYDEGGAYLPVSLASREVPDVTPRVGPDGQNYAYVPDEGWRLEAELGSDKPTPLTQDVTDALGQPGKLAQEVIDIDEPALRVEYERGNWKKEPKLGEDVIRSADEFTTFKGLQALWKRELPRKENETLPDYTARINEKAVEELRASRVDANIARHSGLEPWLDRLNRSPVAKAVRMFRNDPVLTDLPLAIGGDYGWAVRANRFGYKTPPSVLVRAGQHHAKLAAIRSAVDDAWVKFVSGQTKSPKVLGINLSASGNRMSQGVKGFFDPNVVTYNDFGRMVARSIIGREDLDVRGHKVAPEAKEAAAKINAVMQWYDREGHNLGMFNDQRNLERTEKQVQSRLQSTRDRLARFLWDGEKGPRALLPAIKIGDKVFTGKTHDDAILQLIESGPEGGKLAESLGPESRGYVMNPAYVKKAEAVGVTAHLHLPYKRKIDFTVPELKVKPLEIDYDAPPVDDIADMGRFIEAEKAGLRAQGIDERLMPLAERLIDSGLEVIGQGMDNGGPGIRYRTVDVPNPQFASLEAASYKATPQGAARAQILQETLDVIFPHRIDPSNDGVLTIDLTNLDPPDNVLEAYGVTRDEYIKGVLEQGRVTAGETLSFLQFDDSTQQYYADAMIRVALDRFHSKWIAGTAWHEAFHGLWNTGRLTPDEIEGLTNEALKHDWHHKFAQKGKTLSDEEAIAQAVGWRIFNPDDPRLKFDPGGPMQRLADRIVAMWDELKRKIFGGDKPLDFETFIEKMGSGLYGGREAQLSDFKSHPLASKEIIDASTAGKFHTVDELIEQRKASVTPKQKVIVNDIEKQIADLESRLEDIRVGKERVSKPHAFQSQAGLIERYFPRFWNKEAILNNREGFEKMLAAWFARDNPVGADARAQKSVDQILQSQADDTDVSHMPAGLRHLHGRELDIPNGFSHGDLNVIDFIQDDILPVMETYTRRMGSSMEMARMFGDRQMSDKLSEIRFHFWDKYVSKAKTPKDVKVALAMRDEYLAHVELTRDMVLGTFRQSDPWRIDNRAARNLKSVTQLATMGRVVITSLPELLRPAMVHGFGTAFRTLFLRLLGDLDKLEMNRELSAETGELADMVRAMNNVRFEEIQTAGGMVGGGTSGERILEKAMPGFFKVTLLTQWTTALKDWAAFATQHTVMKDAAAIANGTASDRTVMQMAALGISQRDAHLLARMPVDKHGSIILPAVGKWEGSEGRRARALLLDAIAGQTRRTIVTPSLGDKSTWMSGVITRNGKKVVESDAFTLPFQFMSYGIAAHNKVLVSALQGRDKSAILGATMMLMLGVVANYMKTPTNAFRAKSYGDIVLDAYETSGIGGTYFGDTNQMLERFSNDRLGLRPAFGMDPKFGRSDQVTAPIEAAGPGPDMLYQLYRAYGDPTLSTNQRAQIVRRAVPYNNVLWWGSVSRDLASTIAGK